MVAGHEVVEDACPEAVIAGRQLNLEAVEAGVGLLARHEARVGDAVDLELGTLLGCRDRVGDEPLADEVDVQSGARLRGGQRAETRGSPMGTQPGKVPGSIHPGAANISAIAGVGE